MSRYDSGGVSQKENLRQKKETVKSSVREQKTAGGRKKELPSAHDPRQQVEEELLDESQQEFFKYLMGDPDADLTQMRSLPTAALLPQRSF